MNLPPPRTICELMHTCNPASKPIPRDIIIGTEKATIEFNGNSKQIKSTDKDDDLEYEEDAPIDSFRRCSLGDHVKRLKSASSKSAISNSHKSSHQPPPDPPRRRSSLKASFLSPDTSANTRKKTDAFFRDVITTIIEYRDDNYNEAAWYTSEERADIKAKAKEDVKVMKHLKEHPEILESSSEMRKLCASISLRGLEAFISKKTRLALFLNQQRVIHEVLETQELFFRASVDVKAQMLAKVSTEGSLPSRERARDIGLEDSFSVLRYLKSSASITANTPSTSKSQHAATRHNYGRSKSMPQGRSEPRQMPTTTNAQHIREKRGRRKSMPPSTLHFSETEVISGYHSATSGSDHAVC